ncbi:hypothetical protein TNCV_4287621 [Trichonephila clavipes]|uniref:Uncharacterized protein n=1 Tax=Trichonephila clavipes TaxID=2585209 RepID=A0A8X6S799_TRICX|nr:hypothetical protein TNCV_4287621 [Trichonephila clavipes]
MLELKSFRASLEFLEQGVKGHQTEPTNLTELYTALANMRQVLPVECFQKLVESMPRRVVAVIMARGGPTRYLVVVQQLMRAKANRAHLSIRDQELECMSRCFYVHYNVRKPYEWKHLQNKASATFSIALQKPFQDRVLGARAAGVHYRLISVWTLVPVRLGKQLSDHSTVDDFASEAADCRHTYTMANCPQRRLEKPRKKREEERRREREKESSKRQGLVVLGSGEENPRVLFRDADQESKTRMRNNALRTGSRQALDLVQLYRVFPNALCKLEGEVENIVRNRNYTGKHGRKVIGGAVRRLASLVQLYRVFPNALCKLEGEVENIVRNRNYTGKHGRKVIGGAVRRLASLVQLYRVFPNALCKLEGEVENIVRNRNYTGKHGRKVIGGAVRRLASLVQLYRVFPNALCKLEGEVENIVRNRNYTGKHGRKVIGGAVRRLARHPSTLKHISDQEHDIAEEYRSDDERHLALHSPIDR